MRVTMTEGRSFVQRNLFWLGMGAFAVFIGFLGYDSYATQEEREAHREQNCPITGLNPDNLIPGSRVTIAATNDTVFGQVIKTPRYLHEITSGSVFGFDWVCNIEKTFLVRIGTHGIAHDGGSWDTARPEVLPEREMYHFEINHIQ